ncbi:hypothetical protein SYN63AY4M2_12980 [Synechococcus sp. 63AY4M2]|nr:hypothetical protein SYN63AY4M2_12980 [Synechococcus sp. 63AY4M2]PIK89681.1 hypothetical protein SYN65AY6A5_03270 [Synechococcus sp. 65AY6A5]PIK96321.1 hypothetical protein SYN60AY4M2_00010 [Synechococcus sp. 60AY4M2]PIK99158.1 hypothetical protein SYN63AY4M1_10940 [Synechococcus sp. 63AY4M1]PIL02393.1 hypothetical protein SYN65AY640_03085 [Synechococcus sp. 65AY640]
MPDLRNHRYFETNLEKRKRKAGVPRDPLNL